MAKTAPQFGLAVWCCLLIGCSAPTKVRECARAQLPKYRLCLARVTQNREACTWNHQLWVAKWCANNTPARGEISDADFAAHRATFCMDPDRDVAACKSAIVRGLRKDDEAACRMELQLGTRPWPTPPREYATCRGEEECCRLPEKTAALQCEQAAEFALEQCGR